MVSHRPEAVAARRWDPPYRACRNTACWCWLPLEARWFGLDAPPPPGHDNDGNPPALIISPDTRPVLIGRPPQ